ncbi:MerR family transcriptional regulator, partial [Morganella morganii]|nr:MerR family transcriptional regulator [Morganella morganii]
IDPRSTNDEHQLVTESQIKVKRREIDTRRLV